MVPRDGPALKTGSDRPSAKAMDGAFNADESRCRLCQKSARESGTWLAAQTNGMSVVLSVERFGDEDPCAQGAFKSAVKTACTSGSAPMLAMRPFHEGGVARASRTIGVFRKKPRR